MSDKFISFLIPTRKRVIYLKNSINSILKNLTDTSQVEMLFRIDDDDDDTKNIIRDLPFDNLYINDEKIDYPKTIKYERRVDMKFFIGERGNGYQDLHHHINKMFEVSIGKWLFLWSDDVEMLSENWYDEVVRLDSLNKILIAKLTTWNICLIPREIPKLWGSICPNQWIDLWYDEIAKELNLYEESNIEIFHDRVMSGITATEREKFFRAIERSPKWINNTWFGGPPSYDTKQKEEAIEKLKKYIKSKNMNIKNEFSEKLVNFFEGINKKTEIEFQKDFVKEVPDTIICNFINGPFVEIIGNSKNEYTIEFIDNDTNVVVHRTILPPNHWTRANRQWFTNWKIRIYTTELVYEHIYNANNKKVYVHLTSESIGDTIAWFPYIEEFRKKHNCRIVCSTFHNDFFESKYPNIEFVKPGTQVHNLYAMYEIGIYDDNFDRNKNDHKKIPLQKVSADMLGLEFKELRPNISVSHLNNDISGRYVVISTESTSQCKFWNYKGGWQEIVNYLVTLGYKVVVVQKSKSDLVNIIDKSGGTLQNAISIINGAEFVIGISSGIPWLAWALQKKVIMISGFTLPWYEFNENCYRVYNKHVCKGCWHDYVFDKGDWNWCPMKKNFECSSTITPDMVKTQIQIIINQHDYFYTKLSPNERLNLTNTIIQFDYNKPGFDAPSHMFNEIFRDLNYNFKNCKVGYNDVVLDVGANIGVFSRYAIANGAKEIYAFEPIKENYDLLVKNVGEFATSYNAGISNAYKTESFHIDATEGGHTILDIDPNRSRTNEIREIQCYTIDYLFDNHIIPQKIDFMKIDVEGAEIKVLEGISDENLGKINKIAMEWHKFLFNNDRNLLDSIINRLYKNKFQFYIDYNSSDLDTIYFWK